MNPSSAAPAPNILITGGCGFLGKVLLNELLDPTTPLVAGSIRVLDIQPPPENAPAGVTYLQADICDEDALKQACRDIDIVIHAAAIVDWGTHSEEEVYRVNVTGTEKVIQACRDQQVSCLVYTSSLDAIFEGKPMTGVNETQPYPHKHPNMYCKSKRLAEELILKGENGEREKGKKWESGESKEGQEGRGNQKVRKLRRVVIRPSDIWGEGDPYHIASLENMAKGGFYVRLGNGTSKCQHTYVGNVAYAHLLAARALWENTPGIDGSVYFITDGAPSNFFRFFDPIIEKMGYKLWPKNLWIPYRLAYGMGMINEGIAWLLKPIHPYTPKFSRFAVTYTCGDFTFDTDKAKRELGFSPKYGHEEAVARTVVGSK